MRAARSRSRASVGRPCHASRQFYSLRKLHVTPGHPVSRADFSLPGRPAEYVKLSPGQADRRSDRARKRTGSRPHRGQRAGSRATATRRSDGRRWPPAAAPGSAALVIGQPADHQQSLRPASRASSGVATRAWSLTSAPAGRTPGVMSVTSGPTSDRTAETSRGEQTRPWAPASTDKVASRRHRVRHRSGHPDPVQLMVVQGEVSTVTAATTVPGEASTAARMTSGPPAAWTVSTLGRSRATARRRGASPPWSGCRGA